jgi:PAS domain S-box-containing protein/diguanylate cyclase (GGDEF)-like protein
LQNSIRHIITISDITEVSQLQVDLAYTNGQLSQKLAELNVFNTLLNEHALVSEVDVSGIITSVNDKFCKVSGYSRDDLVGTNHNIINSGIHTTEFWQSFWADITAGKVWHGELTNRRKNGDLYWAYSTIMPFLDQKGNVYKFISACTDITKIKNAERKIHQLAYTDTLTKLPNLASFQKSLDNLMLEVRNHESEEKLTICHININDLKEINGTFGWHFGDTLIRLAAIRIQEQLQDAQLIAKVGGNHFGILRKTEHATTEECSQYLNQRLEDIFSLPFDVSGKQMKLSYSSSTVIYPSDLAEFNPHETTADEIQSYLELCRVEIEKSRNNRSIRFDKSILENVSRRTTILHTIEAALENSEVYMVYQPQICLKTNRVIGVEALMRWQKATGEFVSPGDFIPVLEVSDFINALSTWANRVCFNDLLTIQSIIPNCSLAINISAHFLTSPILLNSLQESLNEFNLNPYDIELEVTESGIIEDIDLALSQLRQVKELGFRVSIDDFGTGYSSLAYLVRFPVDQLKIDKSFIRYITLNPQSLSVTKTVISLGKSLNLNVIAEGVETSDQMALLKNEGCDSAQGYYLARPMKLEDLISWYENSEYQT